MKYVFKELRRHLWRTVASIGGYIIATLFMILIITITRNNHKDSLTILKGTGTHFVVYIPSAAPCCKPSAPAGTGSFVAQGVFSEMLNPGMLIQIKLIKGVKDAAPYLLYKMFDEKLNSDISIGGVDTNSIATATTTCSATDVIEGKFISSKKNEVVAEESFARAHHMRLGDTLNIFATKLKIVGIINTGIRASKADIYSTLTNVKNLLSDKVNFRGSWFDMNMILVEVADARYMDDIMNTVKEQNQNASVSGYNCYKPASNVMTIIGNASSIIYVIIFVFLIVFAAKTQTTSLMEQLREIGILKSLGWSNGRLGRQIIAGSMIQALVGIIIGSASAFFILFLMKYFEIQSFETLTVNIQWTQIFFVCTLSFSGGLIASLFPIIKISKLRAGDIMRNYL